MTTFVKQTNVLKNAIFVIIQLLTKKEAIYQIKKNNTHLQEGTKSNEFSPQEKC